MQIMSQIQADTVQEYGFNYLPYQWDEFSKMWRYEAWNEAYAKYRDSDISADEKRIINKSIYQNIDATLEIMQNAVENDPLRYYVPTGDNEIVIQNFAHSLDNGFKIATTGCFAGNGIGKSVLSINITGNLIFGVQNPWFDYPIFHNFPLKDKFIWYCSKSSALSKGGVIENTFRHYLKGKKGWKFNYSSKLIHSIEFEDSPWTLRFKSYGMAKDSFESDNVTVIINDEPPPLNIWKAQRGRSRDGLLMALYFTPIYCPAHILDELRTDEKDKTKSCTVHYASLYGTTKEDGIRGFRSKKEVDATAKGYPADEREARVNGTPTHYHGVVYKEYDEDMHIQPVTLSDFEKYRKGERQWFLPDENAQFTMSIDPADGNRPDAITYQYWNSNGMVVFFGAYPLDTSMNLWEMNSSVEPTIMFTNLRQFEDEFATLLGIESGTLPITRRIIDRRFGAQQRGNDTVKNRYRNITKTLDMPGKWVDSYSSAGTGIAEIKFGHDVVKGLMTSFVRCGNGIVKPRFMILGWDHTYHIVNGIRNYTYKDSLSSGDSIYASLNKIFKDIPDALRYAAADKSNPQRMLKQGKISKNVETVHPENFSALI